MQIIRTLNQYLPKNKKPGEVLGYTQPHELVAKISQLKNIYEEQIKSAIIKVNESNPSTGNNKYRWIALVYKSNALRRFIFNQALPFNIMDEDLKVFASLQKTIFDWYESKAESGSLYSIFQMALHPKYDLDKNPIFGFTRNQSHENHSSMINIGGIFSEDFVRHYHGLLSREIIRNQNVTDTFKKVDEIIELACQSILTTSIGYSSISTIKYKLAEITGNMNIIRKSEHEILSALICLVVVDPGWKYYYYIPYASYSVTNIPYAAIALATSSPCDLNSFLTEPLLIIQPTFYLLDTIERDLKEHKDSVENAWKSYFSDLIPSVDADQAKSLRNNILNGLVQIYSEKWGLDISLIDGDREEKLRNHRTGFVELNKHLPLNMQISRTDESIKGADIHEVVDDIDRTIAVLKDGFKLGNPFCARKIYLQGWLDVDVIASTKIFAQLSKSRIDVDRLAENLREYFESCILGSGALRTNETPDGWMCGFITINEALIAALKLITQLDVKLNNKLKSVLHKSYHLLNEGIGLRIGVHYASVPIELDRQLKDKEEDALNHTGHLQKQGGQKFAQSLLESDINKPTRMDIEENLSWVLTLSKSATETFDELLKEQSKLITDFNSLDKMRLNNKRIDEREVRIYGKKKERKSLFDTIDDTIDVDEILFEGERTYPYIKDEARFVIERIGEQNKSTVNNCLDIGSGSGIYAIAMGSIFENAMVEAIEPSANAILKWENNVEKCRDAISQRIKLAHKTEFIKCKDKLKKNWDIIVFNLPYVPSNDKENTFLHSYGGRDGLLYVRQVLEWIGTETNDVRYVVFPVYSLALCKDLKKEDELTKENTLIYRIIEEIPNLKTKFKITFNQEKEGLLPNWYVLGYSNNPSKFFVRLETAFPEARRRKDVALWLKNLSSEWTHMWHSVIEMKAK